MGLKIRTVLGFIFGFVLGMVLLLGFNMVFRGVWLSVGLVAAVGILLYTHPRLSMSPQTGPYLATLGFGVIGAWMKSVGPSPMRGLQRMASLMPTLFLLLAALCAIVFLLRAQGANEEARYRLLPAIVLCVMACILAYVSGDKGGADPMVNWFMTRFGWTHDQAHLATLCVRKTIHFTFYGSLALVGSLLATPRYDLKRACLFGLSLLVCFASFDEFRQHSSPVRTGSVWDIGLDLLGGLFFVGLLVLTYHRQAQRKTL